MNSFSSGVAGLDENFGEISKLFWNYFFLFLIGSDRFTFKMEDLFGEYDSGARKNLFNGQAKTQ